MDIRIFENVFLFYLLVSVLHLGIANFLKNSYLTALCLLNLSFQNYSRVLQNVVIVGSLCYSLHGAESFLRS